MKTRIMAGSMSKYNQRCRHMVFDNFFIDFFPNDLVMETSLLDFFMELPIGSNNPIETP
jgi:hypothetical protein